ncbi:MAG TPA: hypothetical protein VFQ62_15570 [Methylomirabilota bacterium]|nr:hypothetical protein [Methylomirabilota bacterium]
MSARTMLRDVGGRAIVLVAGRVERKDYVDAPVNAVFWYFVVSTWGAVYAVVYLAPRWL